MKHAVFPLILLVTAPAFAEVDCQTMLHDIRYQDQLVKKQGAELSARYGDIHPPDKSSIAEKRNFIDRLSAYISTVHHDIDDLHWLLDHHCGPTKDEPEAIESAREMEAAVQRITKILDKFVKTERR